MDWIRGGRWRYEAIPAPSWCISTAPRALETLCEHCEGASVVADKTAVTPHGAHGIPPDHLAPCRHATSSVAAQRHPSPRPDSSSQARSH